MSTAQIRERCSYCGGRGRVGNAAFGCDLCGGRGWLWTLTQQEMAERIAALTEQVAQLKKLVEWTPIDAEHLPTQQHEVGLEALHLYQLENLIALDLHFCDCTHFRLTAPPGSQIKSAEK